MSIRRAAPLPGLGNPTLAACAAAAMLRWHQDVHKDTIAVALAEAGLREEVREHGTISNTPAALKALTEKLAGKKRDLRFCYEAGPCGYGIQRQLIPSDS